MTNESLSKNNWVDEQMELLHNFWKEKKEKSAQTELKVR